MSSAQILRFPAPAPEPAQSFQLFPPVQPSGGELCLDRGHISSLCSTAIDAKGRLNGEFMLAVLRRSDEKYSAAVARTYHPDVLHALVVSRVLTATAEYICGRQFDQNEWAESISEFWEMSLKVADRPESEIPNMMAVAVLSVLNASIVESQIVGAPLS